MQPISGVILSYNEEACIGACIDALKQVADEVIVLDSFSNDHTPEIARQKRVNFVQSGFRDYISQKNKALALANFEYVLMLDADEILSEELIDSILLEKRNLSSSIYWCNRRTRLQAKFIDHGLWYPDRKPRLFKKVGASFAGLNPHDKLCLPNENISKSLQGDIIHLAFDSFTEYRSRNNEVINTAAMAMFESGRKAAWHKFILSPAWTFINGFFLRGGFFDGYHGWVVACETAKQCFWKYRKLKKLHRQARQKLAWS